MTGHVYAIESGDAVKIGWAQDPFARLADLNIGSPNTHRLVGFARGTREHEREIHTLCAKERLRGEWFRKGPVVSLFLDHLPAPVKLECGTKKAIREVISKWPSAEALSDDLGLKYRSYARVMMVRGRIPERHWPAVVEAAKRRGIDGVSIKTLEEAHRRSA